MLHLNFIAGVRFSYDSSMQPSAVFVSKMPALTQALATYQIIGSIVTHVRILFVKSLC